ncbi:MAG TPA: type VI secretion system contractile sheath large subunit, partial [Polyangiaceae bacterium]
MNSESSRSFRVVVLSELLPRADWSMTPEPLAEARPIDRSTFDDVLGRFGVALSLELADPFGAAAQRVQLRLDSLKALRPSMLADQVPELRGLRAAHTLLLDLENGRRTQADTAEQIRRAVSSPTWAGQIVEALARHAPAERRAEPKAATPAPSPPHAPAAQGGALDALLDMVALPGEASGGEAPSSEENRVASAVSAALLAARSQHPRGHDASPARALVASAFSALLESILAHPEIVRLERAWRGLRLLVEHSDPRSGAELDVIATRPDTVRAALDRLSEREGAERLRPEVDLLLVDHEASADARDRDLLASWAVAAARLRAPLLSGAHPSLVGFDAMEELGNTRKSLFNSQEAWATGLRALATRDESRWLLLALNGMLLRAPHTPESAGLRDLPFQETDGTARVFACAAYAPAVLAMQSFAKHGHPFELVDRYAGSGVIPNLMVHELGPHEQRVAIAVEAIIASDVQRELARVGLCALASARNRDTAPVVRLPMLYRGAAGPADVVPELTLV